MIVITLLHMATTDQVSNCILITVVDFGTCVDLFDWVWGIYQDKFSNQ